MKLLYPHMLKLDIAAISGFPTITLHAYNTKAATLPPDLLDTEVLSLPAGPNDVDVLATGFDTAHVQVTTGSGLHDRAVAEHALGLLLKRGLALLRNARLPAARPLARLPRRAVAPTTSLVRSVTCAMAPC
ncbi:hypothetical protein VTG60DRAFT_931 [Thermothelomyces hinnuleus]